MRGWHLSSGSKPCRPTGTATRNWQRCAPSTTNGIDYCVMITDAATSPQDLILFNERVTTDLNLQIEDLQRQLHISQLDLSDATNSRRELQLEVQNLTAAFTALSQHLQGRPHTGVKGSSERSIEAVLQSHNPYVVILIDGNGLLVSYFPGVLSVSS